MIVGPSKFWCPTSFFKRWTIPQAILFLQWLHIVGWVCIEFYLGCLTHFLNSYNILNHNPDTLLFLATHCNQKHSPNNLTQLPSKIKTRVKACRLILNRLILFLVGTSLAWNTAGQQHWTSGFRCSAQFQQLSFKTEILTWNFS